MWCVYLFLILIVIYLSDLIICNDRGTRLIKSLPHPKGYFVIGCALDIHVPPVNLFQVPRAYAKTFKDGIYGWWALNKRIVNLFNPEDIERVLSGMQHISKSDAYLMIKPWLREGLLLSHGSKWQQRRKILTPAFHFNILKRFFITLEENSHRLVENLAQSQNKAVDIVPVLSEYTLSCMCETSMGTQIQDGNKQAGKLYKEAVYELGKRSVDRISKIYLANDIIYNLTSMGRQFHRTLKTVRSFTENIIKERRKFLEKYGNDFEDESSIDEMNMTDKKKKTAMLDLLLLAEKQGIIDGDGIQEEVDTFMFEGHDTTAVGLVCCLMLLANHKEVQDKIVEELNEIFGDSDRQATMEDTNNMRYLERCIKESMRLYPPVPFIGRVLSEDVTLSGYTIAKDTECSIHIYDLMRREDLFKNANTFDPDRFLPENNTGRHPYAFIPFSAGPRNCIVHISSETHHSQGFFHIHSIYKITVIIFFALEFGNILQVDWLLGQKFAMLELKSCVSAIMRRFQLLPVTTPEDMEFLADLVLRSSKPVYVKFVERK